MIDVSIHTYPKTTFEPRKIEPDDGSAPFTCLDIRFEEGGMNVTIYTEKEDVESVDRIIRALVRIRAWREDAAERLAH